MTGGRRNFYAWIVRHPLAVILLTLAVTILLGGNIRHLTRDNSVDSMLPENDELLLYTEKMEEVFGHNEFIIAAVSAPDPFTPSTIRKVSDLGREFEFIPGVSRVISATNVKNFRGDSESIWSEPLVDPARLPSTPAEIKAYREDLLSSDLFVRNLVSPEKNSLAIVIHLDEDVDKKAVVEAVRAAVDPYRGPERIRISGSPVINLQVGGYMGRDMGKFFPIVIGVVLAVFFLNFGSLRGTLLPFLTLMFAVVWDLGTMALLKVPLSVIGTMLPTLLIAVGSSYGIHVMSQYYEDAGRFRDRCEAVTEAMVHISPSIFAAGLTTMAGFGSLVLNDTPILRNFGAFAALGVGYCCLISLVLLPASLALMPLPAGRRRRLLQNPLEKILPPLAVFHRRRPALIVGAVLAIAAAALAGYPRLHLETNAVNFFRTDDPVRETIRYVSRHFGGTIPIRTIVDTGREGGIFEDEVLGAMVDYQKHLDTIPEVGKTISVIDHIKDTNQALHGGEKKFHALPADGKKAAQYYFLYSLGIDPEDTRSLIDETNSMATVTARLQQVYGDNIPLGTRRTAEIIEDLEAFARERFPEGVEVTPTGRARDIVRTSDYIVRGFIRSLFFAALFVVAIASFIFRSLSWGLVSVAPTALAIVLNFGLMGWLGIPLDIATTLVSSVAIGIGVDDTLHFIIRYRRELKEGSGEAGEAISRTVLSAGQPIVYTSLALVAGFSVLMLASFRPVIYFGGLTAVTMINTTLGALLLLPVLLLLPASRFLARDSS